MYVKDKQYLANIFRKISTSVTTMNEGILARQQGKIPTEQVIALAAIEQLEIQHEILIALAMLVFDPGTDSGPLPEMPKKIIGF